MWTDPLQAGLFTNIPNLWQYFPELWVDYIHDFVVELGD